MTKKKNDQSRSLDNPIAIPRERVDRIMANAMKTLERRQMAYERRLKRYSRPTDAEKKDVHAAPRAGSTNPGSATDHAPQEDPSKPG